MPWKQLTPDTYYYPGSTNVGYHKGLVIDAGESVPRAEQMALELKEMGLELRWLMNTHGHPDHCGGNAGFIKHGAELIAADFQSGFQMDLELASHFMYGAEVIFGEKRKFRYPSAEPVVPSRIVSPGVVTLGGTDFIIERHRGHALDQITIQTSDNVLFIGDILLPMAMVKRSSLATTFSAMRQFEDFNWLRSTNSVAYIPGHGKPIDDICKLADANESLQNKFINEVYRFCENPKTREDITAHMIQKFRLPDTMSGSSVVYDTVGAYLMYLEAVEKITIFNQKGYTYYKRLCPDSE